MKTSTFLLIAFLLSFITANAQVSVDCPTGTNPGDWTPEDIEAEYYNAHSHIYKIGSVDYQKRTHSGHEEIVIDWNSLVVENNLSESTAKDVLENEIILKEIPNYEYEWQGTIYVVFKTDCYIRVKCVLNLEKNREIECCDDGVTPLDWYEWQGHSCYDVYKTIYCGYKCCRRAYSVELNWDNIKEEYVGSITGVTTETYPGSNCSGSSPYIDCQTQEPIPCEGNCE
jgi:hypothetical protein